MNEYLVLNTVYCLLIVLILKSCNYYGKDDKIKSIGIKRYSYLGIKKLMVYISLSFHNKCTVW